MHDFCGDFEISNIASGNCKIKFDGENNTFEALPFLLKGKTVTFSILANVQYKKVGYVCIPYNLVFSANRLRYLKRYEYFEEYFVLPNYDHMKFKYVIKQDNELDYELVIENPLKVEIQGKQDFDGIFTIASEDFKYKFMGNKGLDLKLLFAFDPINDDLPNQEQSELKEISVASKTKTDESSETTNTTLYEIMSNTEFADVVIFSSTNKEILTYRCVLAKYSSYFAKHFAETKELPVQITLKDDDTETIKAALDFCYGKTESILGKETKVFDFANKYSFAELKKACSYYFEKSVNPKNVCEIVQIAYANNFESLKEKCHKILADNKGKIDPTELKKLPQDVFINVFYA